MKHQPCSNTTIARSTSALCGQKHAVLRGLVCTLVCMTGAGVATAQAHLDGNLLKWDPTYGLYSAASNGSTLVWPPGVYDIDSDSLVGEPVGYCFYLVPDTGNPSNPRRCRTNMTIEATGVTLAVRDPTIGVFFLRACDGLIINGLSVTYDPLPYNQSVVTSVNLSSHTFDVALQPGFMGFENTFFAYGPFSTQPYNNYGILYDAATMLPKAGTFTDFMHIDGQQHLGGANYRLTANAGGYNYLAFFSPGDIFVYNGRRLGRSIFDLALFEPTSSPYNRPPLTLQNCTVRAGVNIFANISACPGISDSGASIIRNCSILAAGPDSLISTNGDGVFVGGCRVGPLVEDCTFERMSDNAFDLHGGPRRLFMGYPVAGDYSLADFAPGGQIRVGDRLQLFDPITGAVELRDISAIPAGGPSETDWKRVLLSTPAVGMTGNGVDPATSTNAFNTSTACPSFTIRNNTIRRNRGKGALIQAVEGVFANNVISDSCEMGIQVTNIPGGGPVPFSVSLRGNRITHCGYIAPSNAVSWGSSICVFGSKGLPFGGPSELQTTMGINIEGNTIENWNTAGVYVGSIRDSVIAPYLGMKNSFKGLVSGNARAVIVAYPAGNTVINGLTTAGAIGLEYAVRIEAGVELSVLATGIITRKGTLPLEDLR